MKEHTTFMVKDFILMETHMIINREDPNSLLVFMQALKVFMGKIFKNQ